MSKTIQTKILLRNDTAVRWTSNNPTLGKGEIGVEVDTKKFKFGDGTTPWNSLGYGSGADIDLATAARDGLLSKEDYAKLAGIDSGAEVNIIETVKVNGTALTVTDKAVDITVPTKTSDITNDSGFITLSQVPEGAVASTTTPNMDGTATAGTETAFARGDHVHPTDTTRASATDLTSLETKVNNVFGATGTGAVTTIGTGANNGTISVTITNTSGVTSSSEVSVFGLGSAAYLNTTDTYDANGSNPVTGKAVASAISTAISSVFKYKGTKADVASLPASGNEVGDVWHVTADDGEYAWTGTAWESLGGTIDLSSYLTSITIAGTTIDASNTSITANQLQTALGLGDAAYKAVDTSIPATPGTNLPTSSAVAQYVSNNASKVTSSSTNGNIQVDNSEMNVYTLPNTVLDSSDTLILDCGDSTTNYTVSS